MKKQKIELLKLENKLYRNELHSYKGITNNFEKMNEKIEILIGTIKNQSRIENRLKDELEKKEDKIKSLEFYLKEERTLRLSDEESYKSFLKDKDEKIIELNTELNNYKRVFQQTRSDNNNKDQLITALENEIRQFKKIFLGIHLKKKC